MNEVKKKLIGNYSSLLTSDEIENIDKLSEEEIRRLVNRVWANLISYDDNFCFLKTFVCLGNLTYFDGDIDAIINYESTPVELYYPALLDHKNIDETGMALDVDFTKTKEVYLPIDFDGKALTIHRGYKPKFIFSVHTGEGVFNNGYNAADCFSKSTGIPFRGIDLRMYYPDLVPNEKELVRNAVSEYLMDRVYYGDLRYFDVDLRDSLCKKYHKYIVRTFQFLEPYCRPSEILLSIKNHIKFEEMEKAHQI